MSEPCAFDCYQAFKRLDDFVDRELTGEEMEQVKRHLELCEACAIEFQFEDDVLKCLKEKLQRIDLPPDLMQRLSSALDEA